MRNDTLKKAFSLIEILVVIGIVGGLLVVMSISYSSVQKKSRDTVRKRNLNSISNSLEQYYSICGYKYPTPQSNQQYRGIFCNSPSIGILPTAPVDPKTATPYIVSITPSSGSPVYTICTTLEAETVTSYCLSNQQ